MHIQVMEMAGVKNGASMGGRYPTGMYSFLLEHGVEATGGTLPQGMEMGVPQSCYENAYHLAMNFDELVYVEGLAMRPTLGFATGHAWVVHATRGNVIDNTWDEPEDVAYFGVQFETDFVARHIMLAGYYGIFGNHWLIPEAPMYRNGVKWNDKGRVLDFA